MAEIEIYAKPSSLYRYRKLGESTPQEIAALLQAYVFCPAYSELNDPMEGTYRLSTRFQNNPSFSKSNSRVQAAFEAMGVASFSEVHNHEPMWAHYADKFKGMCIQYNLNKLLRGLGEGTAMTRMMYSEQEPVLVDDSSKAVERARKCLSSKTVRWANEREWRIFSEHRGEASYGDRSTVTRIYLGSRINPEDEATVLAAAKELGVPVNKMDIKAYALDFKPLWAPVRRKPQPKSK
jgi:hypothetical protein